MKVLVTQSNFFPWIGFFDIISSSDLYIIYDEVQFTRRDWRSRNKLVQENQNNRQNWFSIPVHKKGQYLSMIEDISIVSVEDKYSIVNKLSAAYGKNEFWSDIYEHILDPFQRSQQLKLSALNELIIRLTCDYLEIETKIVRSNEIEYNREADSSRRLAEICSNLQATTYFTGLAAKPYLKEREFADVGCKVDWINFEDLYDLAQRPYLAGTIIGPLSKHGKQTKQLFKL